MIEVTFIVGLPGSGKTTLARRLAKPGDTMIDDLDVRIREALADTIESARGATRLILTDTVAVLYAPWRLEIALANMLRSEINVSFVAFENDPDACWENVCRRADGRIIDRAYIRTLSRGYDPKLFNREPLPVYRGG